MSDFLKSVHHANIVKGTYALIAPCTRLARCEHTPGTSFPVIIPPVNTHLGIAQVEEAAREHEGRLALKRLHLDPWFHYRAEPSPFSGPAAAAEVLAAFTAGQSVWTELTLIRQRTGNRQEAVPGLSNYRLHDHLSGFLVTFNDSAVMLAERRLACRNRASARLRNWSRLALAFTVITTGLAYDFWQVIRSHVGDDIMPVAMIIVLLCLGLRCGQLAGEAQEEMRHLDAAFRSASRRNAYQAGEHLRSRQEMLGRLQDNVLVAAEAVRDRNWSNDTPAQTVEEEDLLRSLAAVIGAMRTSNLDFARLCNDLLCALAQGVLVGELYRATHVRFTQFFGIDKRIGRYIGLFVVPLGVLMIASVTAVACKLEQNPPVLAIGGAGAVGLMILLILICRAFLALDKALCKMIDPDLVAELARSLGPDPHTPSPDGDGEATQSASARRKAERQLRRDKLRRP